MPSACALARMVWSVNSLMFQIWQYKAAIQRGRDGDVPRCWMRLSPVCSFQMLFAQALANLRAWRHTSSLTWETASMGLPNHPRWIPRAVSLPAAQPLHLSVPLHLPERFAGGPNVALRVFRTDFTAKNRELERAKTDLKLAGRPLNVRSTPSQPRPFQNHQRHEFLLQKSHVLRHAGQPSAESRVHQST